MSDRHWNDEALLRWSPGPEDSRYQVQVTTKDLRLLSTVRDLTRPEVVIDPARLADVPRGSRVLWQVEVTLPDGERAAVRPFSGGVAVSPLPSWTISTFIVAAGVLLATGRAIAARKHRPSTTGEVTGPCPRARGFCLEQ